MYCVYHGLLYWTVAVGYHTSWSFRTRKARTTWKIDRKAREHVIGDVLAVRLDVGIIG